MAVTAFDDMLDALHTAQTSTFRFEGHQDYPDDELWQMHQRGQWWEQDPDLAQWCALVSGNADRGVTMTRVRATIEPWTDYTRWEIEQHFPHNLRAREDIRLWRTDGELRLPDFHLVDGARAWFLAYDPNGAMTVTEATERTLPTLRAWRDDALARSEPLTLSAS